MKLCIFGLTVSSSWGNGHATLWRGLINALSRRGHQVVFFEKDVPYYAAARDLKDLPGGSRLLLYSEWHEVLPQARRHLGDADAAMVTSYCPDGARASRLVLASRARTRAFYDLDTPVTLGRVRAGETVEYLPPDGLAGFDIVLSYTGGATLEALRTELCAGRVAPLYGHVDPSAHHPVPPRRAYRCDLSYMGTFAADRQAALEMLLVEPARRLPHRRFLIGGALYPAAFPWTDNLSFVRHMPPREHPAFFSSSRLTLNVTRKAMAEAGYCPSGRLFEAAACGTPVLSDAWEGLETFLEPGQEILIGRSTEEAVAALELPDAQIARIAKAARDRVLEEHTSDRRAVELEELLEQASSAVETPRSKGARS